MYNIEDKELNEKTHLVFHGAINSVNAEEVGNLINEKISGKSAVVFDFEDVDYISSAGLRLILKAGKCVSSFEVINVVPEVYEVFDMTGFTQILKISKAMRTVSIEGKELIGEGFIGKVYRLDPETIIKVYKHTTSLDDVKREIGLAKKAFVLGIPTAIPFDVVKVNDGSYGSVFELLNSSCFNKFFIEHPENIDTYIDMYINLLKSMMAIDAKDDSGLPHKKNEAKFWLKDLTEKQAFEPDVLEKMAKLIDSIPEENHVIHGDYHIKNIMMQGNEPLLIDMDTLGVGHEIFEITAFYLTYVGYPSTDKNNSMDFLGVSQDVSDRIFDRTINEIYADRSEEERKLIIDKLACLGYFWLTYKTYFFEPENLVRLNHSKQEVIRLANKLDTLAF